MTEFPRIPKKKFTPCADSCGAYIGKSGPSFIKHNMMKRNRNSVHSRPLRVM